MCSFITVYGQRYHSFVWRPLFTERNIWNNVLSPSSSINSIPSISFVFGYDLPPAILSIVVAALIIVFILVNRTGGPLPFRREKWLAWGTLWCAGRKRTSIAMCKNSSRNSTTNMRFVIWWVLFSVYLLCLVKPWKWSVFQWTEQCASDSRRLTGHQMIIYIFDSTTCCVCLN